MPFNNRQFSRSGRPAILRPNVVPACGALHKTQLDGLDCFVDCSLAQTPRDVARAFRNLGGDDAVIESRIALRSIRATGL